MDKLKSKWYSSNCQLPPQYADIQSRAEVEGFDMASNVDTGCLIRTLSSTKPGGRFLELGTGIGHATCWMLAGMDESSTLISIDLASAFVDIARIYLGDDRLTLLATDASNWLVDYSGPSFDFIFADAWPGKYSLLEEALGLLSPGGLYIIDDMLPQLNWPEGHAAKAEALINSLESHQEIEITKINWSTGIIICAKKP